MHHRDTEDTEILSLCALCVSVVSYIRSVKVIPLCTLCLCGELYKKRTLHVIFQNHLFICHSRWKHLCLSAFSVWQIG